MNHLFGDQGRETLQLPVHVVYSVSPALINGQPGIDLMPAIKVRSKDGKACKQTIEVVREIVFNRIPPEDLKWLFGSEWETRLETLILASGGHLRYLVTFLQKSLGQRNFPLSEQGFREVCTSLDDEYRRMVFEEHFSFLAKVSQEKYVTVTNQEQRPILDSLLKRYAIFCYRNGSEWYDIHPSVAKIPGVMEAVQTYLRAKRERS